MAHDDGFSAVGLGEGSDFDVAFLGVRDGEHAGVLGVEGAEAARIIARVEAVYQGQVGKVVDVGLDGKDDNNPIYRSKTHKSAKLELINSSSISKRRK